MKPHQFKYKVRKLIESIVNSLIEYMEKEYFLYLSFSMRTAPLLKIDFYYYILWSSVHCTHDVLKYLFQDK